MVCCSISVGRSKNIILMVNIYLHFCYLLMSFTAFSILFKISKKDVVAWISRTSISVGIFHFFPSKISSHFLRSLSIRKHFYEVFPILSWTAMIKFRTFFEIARKNNLNIFCFSVILNHLTFEFFPSYFSKSSSKVHFN